MKKKTKSNSKISNISLYFTIFLVVIMALAGFSRAKLSPSSDEAIQIEPSSDYLSIQVDEKVQMIVTDPDGNVAHGQFNGINDSSFSLLTPEVNGSDPSSNLGNPYWKYAQMSPQTGLYEILLQTEIPRPVNVWMVSYDKGGMKFLFEETFEVDEKGIVLLLTNDPTDFSNTSLRIK